MMVTKAGRQGVDQVATRGEEGGKVLILKDRTECAMEREIGQPMGEGGPRHTCLSSETDGLKWSVSDISSPYRAGVFANVLHGCARFHLHNRPQPHHGAMRGHIHN